MAQHTRSLKPSVVVSARTGLFLLVCILEKGKGKEEHYLIGTSFQTSSSLLYHIFSILEC